MLDLTAQVQDLTSSDEEAYEIYLAMRKNSIPVPIPQVLENANENLTPRMRNLVAMLWSEWKELELQIVEMNDEVERIASSDLPA
jgi:hypothetical protein